MLSAMRKQDEEAWQDLEYCSADSIESRDTLASLVTPSEFKLLSTSSASSFLNSSTDNTQMII